MMLKAVSLRSQVHSTYYIVNTYDGGGKEKVKRFLEVNSIFLYNIF